MTSRGMNFTEREKYMLLEIVQKYKHIIENKCTNAVTTLKKNEAWERITKEFNSTAEIPRSQKQLNTAYLNLKRHTRQNVANQNVKLYLEQKKNYACDSDAGLSQVNIPTEESSIHSEMKQLSSILKQFQKGEIADKKGIMATGGGTYKPVLSTVGAQILSMMGDQVKPLSNSCDSASNYYKNVEDVIKPTETVVQICDVLKPTETVSCDVTNTSDNNDTYNKSSYKNVGKIQKKKKIVPKNNNILKKQYYEKKMKSASLEEKIKLSEYRLILKKHKLLDLEIKIKQKEYENIIKKL